VLAQGQSLVLPRVADDQRFLDRLSLYDYDLPFIAVPLMGPHSRPIGVLAAQPMARQEERLPACTRFLETVANLVAQTIRLMILPTSAAQPPQQSPRVERPRACTPSRGFGLENMVGKSPAMRQIMDIIRQVSRWDTTVLVRGESGTGKELIANAIHHNSRAPPPHSSNLTARRCRTICWRASCSAMRKARLPARCASGKAALSWRTAAPYSWMKSVKAAPRFRPSCCEFCKKERWSASAAMKPCASTYASSRRPTAIWKRRCGWGISAKTFTTA
jgi:hypothetical protein